MKMTLLVETDDDEWTITADGRDIRKWESSEGKSFFGEVEGISYSLMCRLAFLASVRNGAFSGDWDAFDAVCVAVTQQEVSPLNPTRQDRGASSSSQSPLLPTSPSENGNVTLQLR